MLVFLDESYDNSGSGQPRAYAGFGIREHDYRTLVARVYQLRQHYIVGGAGMSDDDKRNTRATHLVTDGDPDLFEIKGSILLSNSKLRGHAKTGAEPGVLLVEGLLELLGELGATVFGALQQSGRIEPESEELLPLELSRCLERVEAWMREQHPDGAAVIVLDRVNDVRDRDVSERMARFLFRSQAGRRMRHLVVNPFWVDSRTTAGSQLADLVAHILMNSLRPINDRKNLDWLWRKVVALEFRSTDQVTRGIRRLRRTKAGGS